MVAILSDASCAISTAFLAWGGGLSAEGDMPLRISFSSGVERSQEYQVQLGRAEGPEIDGGEFGRANDPRS